MPSSFKEELLTFLKPEQIDDGKAAMVCYSSDASTIERKPLGVIWPENTDQISKIIKIARDFKVPVVPRGGGTGLVGSAVPLDAIVIDMSRMKTIYGIIVRGGGERKEFSCIVDPGVTVAELNDYLKKDGLYFPVVPSSHKVCTIGGIISTNAAGNRAVKYGKAIDWVEEVDFVDGRGEIIKITQINDVCGKEGVLGIIAKAKLKVTHLPTNTSMDVIETESIEEMIEKINDLDFRNILSVEMINKMAGELVGTKNIIFVEYADQRGTIKNGEMAKLWKKREGTYSICASKGYSLICDPQIPSEKLKSFLKWVETKSLPAFGHIGVGIIHVLVPDNNHQLMEEILQMSIEHGGELTGEHGIGMVKAKFINEEYRVQIKKLKEKYDPDDIMNRGKLI